jgi:hypothetical protein
VGGVWPERVDCGCVRSLGLRDELLQSEHVPARGGGGQLDKAVTRPMAEGSLGELLVGVWGSSLATSVQFGKQCGGAVLCSGAVLLAMVR